VKLTTHLELLPRSRKCGYIHPLPHTPPWCRDNFTFYVANPRRSVRAADVQIKISTRYLRNAKLEYYPLNRNVPHLCLYALKLESMGLHVKIKRQEPYHTETSGMG
jgi:hypothetical protein